MSGKRRVLLFPVAVLLTLLLGSWWWTGRPTLSDQTPPPAEPVPPAPAVSDGFYQDDWRPLPGELLVEADATAVPRLDAALQTVIPTEHSWVGPWSHMDDKVMLRVLVDPGQEALATQCLQQQPGVDSVEPDYVMHAYGGPIGKPNDPLYPYLWNMHKVGAEGAWRGSTGQGVVVAVIDTGVAYEDYNQFHKVEDMNPESFVPGWNALNNTAHANDDQSHGTHVAATIAEWTNNEKGAIGLAPDALIMPVKVLNASGAGSYGTICDGIRWAADHHANVINMSLGGPIGTLDLARAISYAHQRGVTVVCAAGNNGSNSVGYPAKYKECIAVSSIRFDDTLAWYSNRGSRIDIAAPGGDTRVDQNNDGYPDGILQNTIERGDPTKEGYFLFQGTSMASPHVAAAAALIEALGITNPDAVKAVLQQSARKNIPDRAKGFGAGVLDANKAVKVAILGTGTAQFVLALVLLVLTLRLARGGDYAGFSPFLLPGLVVAGCGVFFLPYLPQLGGQEIPYRDFLCRPIAAWDIHLLGLSHHGNPLFYSAMLPLAVSLVLNQKHSWIQQLLIGFSVGYGACLLHLALSDQARVQWVPSFLHLPTAWLIVNAAMCIFIAIGLADARRPKRS